MLSERIVNINCIGCGMCASIDKSIKFEMTEQGFLRPHMPENYDFSFLERICPIVYEKEEDISDVWGKYKQVLAVRSLDEQIMWKASSGGTITTMLLWMLDNREVDAVIQIGAQTFDPIRNAVYVSKTREDVIHCAGSRYSPASPLISIVDALESDLTYAFVGKPCDIRALRKYAKINLMVDEKIKYFISFFCAGTPSENASKRLIKELGANENKIKSIAYRANGWPGYATVIDDKSTYEMEYEKSWGGILGRTKQQYCRICPDGTGEWADISCGDGWKLTKEKKPDFSDSQGRNVVFVRTEQGKYLLDKCVQAGVLVSEEYDVSELRYVQPYQYERKVTLVAQSLALRLFGKYTPRFGAKHLLKLARGVSLKVLVRIFFGTCKRILKGIIK